MRVLCVNPPNFVAHLTQMLFSSIDACKPCFHIANHCVGQASSESIFGAGHAWMAWNTEYARPEILFLRRNLTSLVRSRVLQKEATAVARHSRRGDLQLHAGTDDYDRPAQARLGLTNETQS